MYMFYVLLVCTSWSYILITSCMYWLCVLVVSNSCLNQFYEVICTTGMYKLCVIFARTSYIY